MHICMWGSIPNHLIRFFSSVRAYPCPYSWWHSDPENVILLFWSLIWLVEQNSNQIKLNQAKPNQKSENETSKLHKSTFYRHFLGMNKKMVEYSLLLFTSEQCGIIGTDHPHSQKSTYKVILPLTWKYYTDFLTSGFTGYCQGSFVFPFFTHKGSHDIECLSFILTFLWILSGDLSILKEILFKLHSTTSLYDFR